MLWKCSILNYCIDKNICGYYIKITLDLFNVFQTKHCIFSRIYFINCISLNIKQKAAMFNAGFNGDEEIDDKLLCEFLRKKKTASSSEGPLERSDSWVPPKTPLLEQGEGSVYKRATQPPNNVQIDRESSF